MHPEIGRSGFAGNAIAGSQGQLVCENHGQACIVHGKRMFLLSPRKPGLKAGISNSLSIEALCARPAYSQFGGIGEETTFAIGQRAQGVRNR